MNVRKRFTATGVDADHANYKWWALSCTSLGMLLVATNSGTLIIALPDLERALGTSLLTLVWVILAYMISSTVLVLTAGRLSDLFGRKTAFVAAFVIFAAASLGAGFAANGTQLILWRIVQGIGGAFIFANGPALVTDAFPREQLGLAMGTNTMVAAIGLVIGPVLGGALVGISWQWVFWFNVPLALLGALWAATSCASSPPATRSAASTSRHAHLRGRADRAGLRDLARRDQRLGRHRGDRQPDRRRPADAAVHPDRAALRRADARPDDLQATASSPRPRRPPSSTGSPASP